jgi:osmotically-inducible protein OsmY
MRLSSGLIDAANIGVAVDKGVVPLCGHVKSYAHKIAAEQTLSRNCVKTRWQFIFHAVT